LRGKLNAVVVEEAAMTPITNAHVAMALRCIALRFGTTTFTDFVRQVQIQNRKWKYLSDDLVYDLKYDNTLPPTFNSLDQFRWYLRSQGACYEAMRLAPAVWKRYRRWVAAGLEERS
jgi:hypothetical protein